MDLTTLDYILLVFIAAILIHILITTFGRKYGSREPYGMPMLPINDNSVKNNGSKQHLIRNGDNYSYEPSKSNSNCPAFSDNNPTTDLLKDIGLGGKFLCENNDDFDYSNLKEYQTNFWDFQDKINASSSNDVDAVDKINELQLSGNNELIDARGTTISDLYNTLTGSPAQKKKDYDDSIKTCARGFTDCPAVGNTTDPLKIYTKYKDDGVNNGGKFFKDVEGVCMSDNLNMPL